MVTIVSKAIKDAAMNRPDWPEFERKMKLAYGEDWKLVTYEEAAAAMADKKKGMKDESTTCI